MKNIWIILVFISIISQAQWVNNPAENTIINSSAGAHYVPKVATTPNGNYYFSWYGGFSNLNMNLAYFDHDGVSIWNSSMIVSSHSQNSWVDDYTLLADLEGNAIIIFSDTRNGNKDVVVYKVDSEGNQLWGEDGIVFPIANSDEYQPKAVISSDNHVYVLFSTNFSNGSTNIIKIHQIAPNGDLIWGENGKTFSGFGASWTLPTAIANADGGITFAYFEETGSFPAITRHISAIRINAIGDMLWPSKANITNLGGISAWDNLKIFGNGNGGVYCAWNDDRYFNNTSEVYAQYINEDGQAQWTENGALMGSEQNGHQLYQIPAGLNNSGEFIVLWNLLNSSQSQGALKYQRVSTNGTLLEGNNGSTIIGMTEQMQNGISACQMGDTTFYLYTFFFPGSTYLSTYNMLALNYEGNQIWNNPVELCNSNIDRTHANMSTFQANQAVVCWSDSDNGSERIMAQNIFVDGNLGSSTVNTQGDNLIEKEHFFDSYNKKNYTLRLKNIKEGDILEIYNIQGQLIFRNNALKAQIIHTTHSTMFIANLLRNGKILEHYKFIP